MDSKLSFIYIDMMKTFGRKSSNRLSSKKQAYVKLLYEVRNTQLITVPLRQRNQKSYKAISKYNETAC